MPVPPPSQWGFQRLGWARKFSLVLNPPLPYH
jgi:hypothetical protein